MNIHVIRAIATLMFLNGFMLWRAREAAKQIDNGTFVPTPSDWYFWRPDSGKLGGTLLGIFIVACTIAAYKL